ncbi:MAG: transcription termination/antitermination protein NusA [Bacilli bacterium]|nr:transcription termination/antitermination protein NusA [Bacilli bacterium]
MDTKEFKKAVDLLSKEKGISEDIIYDAMELALTSAYKKNYHSLSNVRVDIDRVSGEIHIYSYKTVVEVNEHGEVTSLPIVDTDDGSDDAPASTSNVETKSEEVNSEGVEENDIEDEPEIIYFDERIHLTPEEAKKVVPDIKVGETIEQEVTPKDFGRVAAATAKQVVIQKIREAERNTIIDEFSDKQDELMVGIVAMEDARNYYIDLGRTQGILPKTEIIPGETIKMGSSLKVYITKVETSGKGPLILLSRNHYGFVKRLFELEIPEINEGIILVYSVAREAGNRTKIAVYSENNNVDAIGSCIGEKGSRINKIIEELNGEKIDIVEYNNEPNQFIENALSPAKNLSIFVTDEKKREAMVIVDQDNLSLAIGKKGLNIRLAARLTHYKLDVKTYEQAKAEGINIVI